MAWSVPGRRNKGEDVRVSYGSSDQSGRGQIEDGPADCSGGAGKSGWGAEPSVGSARGTTNPTNSAPRAAGGSSTVWVARTAWDATPPAIRPAAKTAKLWRPECRRGCRRASLASIVPAAWQVACCALGQRWRRLRPPESAPSRATSPGHFGSGGAVFGAPVLGSGCPDSHYQRDSLGATKPADERGRGCAPAPGKALAAEGAAGHVRSYGEPRREGRTVERN
jgi:hypothetical protein